MGRNTTSTTIRAKKAVGLIVLAMLLAIGLACLNQFRRHAPVPVMRTGHEIVVCGQYVAVGAPVVLWDDPGGYNGLSAGKERRAGIDDLKSLTEVVDQFVIHYDQCGLSQTCFSVLQERGLGVHFMLDLDGTIYQTVDLRQRTSHATKANERSIGIEIANRGAYADGERDRFDEWYKRDRDGHVRIVLPAAVGDGGIRTKDFVPRPIREQMVRGVIQGSMLHQYDLTPQQYDSLIKLTAALCRTFPKIKCDYPRDGAGRLITHQLTSEQFADYHGLLGHYHVQDNKVDPGPAFQWDRVVEGARGVMGK